MALLQLDDLMAAPKPAASGLDVTPAAIERVRQLLAANPDKAGQGLRLYVTSGGCAGYSYGMAFDEQGDNDTVMEFDSLKIFVDRDSLQWLDGARVDFVESMLGSGFSITNPNAKSTCGCGTSFSKGDGAATGSSESCR